MGHICSYIKVGITGGCAAFMLALSTALRSLMLILASAAFGSLMFAGALSGKHRILLTTHYVNNRCAHDDFPRLVYEGVVGGGMISLSGFMNGTFGACNPRGSKFRQIRNHRIAVVAKPRKTLPQSFA